MHRNIFLDMSGKKNAINAENVKIFFDMYHSMYNFYYFYMYLPNTSIQVDGFGANILQY